jgi:hypothetical protein
MPRRAKVTHIQQLLWQAGYHWEVAGIAPVRNAVYEKRCRSYVSEKNIRK